MYSQEIMEFAISSADADFSAEVPVVAVIAIGKEIISVAKNQVELCERSWYHAEFLAVSEACEVLRTRYLDMASIYVTLEPCAFCASLLEKVRIKNIFFGAYDTKCGAIDHGIRLFDHSMISPYIIGGIQEQRCSNIIKNFFERIRKNE